MHPRLSWLLVIGLFLGLAMLWNNSISGQAQSTAGKLSLAMEKYATGGLAPALISSVPSCYTWDFLNNSGLDATGLVIHLKGIPSVTDVYTGVLNPFGAPDPSSGYDSTTDVYSLIFGGGTVPDSGMAQIGICTSQPALRLDTVQPAFYWVVPGTTATPDPLFAGLDFNWIDPNHLQVHLYNEQSTPLTLYSFYVLTPIGPLSLDDLNDGVASTLPMVNDQITDPLELAGGANTTSDIFFNQGGVHVAFGAPIVLEAVLSTQDDSGNSIHLIAQTSQTFAQIYLPLLMKK